MSEEFTPDMVINVRHPLFRHADAFLNGERIERCFEARIKIASFDEPTFGELAVGNPEARVALRPPQLGEFDHSGLWVRFICGKVLITLTDEGKQILAKMKWPKNSTSSNNS